MTKPVLFLDVDGVLNSKRWYEHPDARGGCRVESLDPACCAELDRVLRATNATIVLSSSWRYGWQLEDGTTTHDRYAVIGAMRGLLAARGVRAHILDRTPLATEIDPTLTFKEIPGHPGYRMFENEVRGAEIRRWLLTAPLWARPFAVVDDDADMGDDAEILARFVRTDNAVGLTASDADRLIALLSERP